MENENNNKPKKREIMQYFDLFFGLYNSFVMSFMVLIILGILALAIIAHVCIIILITGTLITYVKKNPFHIYFNLGTFACGAFYSIPGIIVIPMMEFSYGIFDYIIFGIAILEIVYLIMKTKDSALLETWGKLALISDRAQYDASLYYALNAPETGRIIQQQALEEEEKERKIRQEYNKQYKRSWIITICAISIFGYYAAYFYSFGLKFNVII